MLYISDGLLVHFSFDPDNVCSLLFPNYIEVQHELQVSVSRTWRSYCRPTHGFTRKSYRTQTHRVTRLSHVSLAACLGDIDTQCWSRSDAAESGVWSGCPLFAYIMFYFKKLNKNWNIPRNILSLHFLCVSLLFLLYCLVCSLQPVITCWDRADLLALMCGVVIWFCRFPIWFPKSGVALDCIHSWSLSSSLLCGPIHLFLWKYSFNRDCCFTIVLVLSISEGSIFVNYLSKQRDLKQIVIFYIHRQSDVSLYQSL